MSNTLITELGEVAARSANRAIEKGTQAGLDQNRGQFVAMVMAALKNIPEEIRGEEVIYFIETYKHGAYGMSTRAAGK